jgi:hypothetical protein
VEISLLIVLAGLGLLIFYVTLLHAGTVGVLWMAAFNPANLAGSFSAIGFYGYFTSFAFIGAFIGEVAFLLAQIADRRDDVGVIAIITPDLLLLGAVWSEMPLLSAVEAGKLTAFDFLGLVPTLALLRAVSNAMTWLLAAVAEQSPHWVALVLLGLLLRIRPVLIRIPTISFSILIGAIGCDMPWLSAGKAYNAGHV